MRIAKGAALVAAMLLAGGSVLAGPARAAALAPGDYKVGFVAEITGPIAFAGKSFLAGAQLAADEISANGWMGKGTHISVLVKDSASDAARAIQDIHQFIADRSVIATTCCILSPVANSVKPIVASAGIPLVIHGATLPGLPAPPWVYSMTVLPGPKDVATAVKMAETTKPKSVTYFLAADNDAFKARLGAARAALEKMGVKTAGVVSVLTADTDFTAPATQAMGEHPDAILIYTTQAPAVGIIAALRQRGYTGTIVGNDVLSPASVFKKLGPAVVGIPFPIGFSSDLATTPEAKAFVAGYKAKFGNDPDIYSAQGYEAIWFIAQGLRAAGGKPTRATLAKTLAAQHEVTHNVYGGEPITGGQIDTAGTTIVAWSADGKLVPWTGAK
ncbi:MAG: ABC transporter substrate-binding protein [Rhodospirillales bacterium]|nr:ABC transporter substrate-binding protein [Rhodospirillales bacterium]MDE2198441.1 ABC transporter substrate-binding protein [Rhodospirillales bacterium]MDE2576781.1 ABC transporter substrate-binding protein [Rhodospirillales bacterium]